MIGLLMNFILMGIVLSGLLKAYYDIPFLNENPKTSGTVAVMVALIAIWIFPKILGFFIKLAGFACVVYFICQTMGWKLDFLKSAPDKALKKVEDVADDITKTLDKVKLATEPNQTFNAKATAIKSGSNLQFGDETVQLYGIDAPDTAQNCKNRNGSDYNCGSLSQEKLQTLVSGQDVQCESKGKNRNGQIVATCTVGGDDVAALMVRSGWAIADQAVTDKYVPEERNAYGQKIGMWEGKFQSPWSWRLRHGGNETATSTTSDSTSDKVSPFQKLMNFFTK